MECTARDAIAVAIREAASGGATYHEGADRVLAALAEQGYTVAKLKEVPGAGWRPEHGDVCLVWQRDRDADEAYPFPLVHLYRIEADRA